VGRTGAGVLQVDRTFWNSPRKAHVQGGTHHGHSSPPPRPAGCPRPNRRLRTRLPHPRLSRESISAFVAGKVRPGSAPRAPPDSSPQHAALKRGRTNCSQSGPRHSRGGGGATASIPYLGQTGNGATMSRIMDGSSKWDMICGIGVYFLRPLRSRPDPHRRQRRLSSDTAQHGKLQFGWEALRVAETQLSPRQAKAGLKYCLPHPPPAHSQRGNALKVCFQKQPRLSR